MKHGHWKLAVMGILVGLSAYADGEKSSRPVAPPNPLTIFSIKTDKAAYQAGDLGTVEIDVQTKAGYDFPGEVTARFVKALDAKPDADYQRFGFEQQRIDAACTERCTLRIPFIVPDYVESGTWTLDTLLLNSKLYGEKVHKPSEVFNAFSTNTLAGTYLNFFDNEVDNLPVVKFNVTGTHPDTIAPKILSISTDKKTYRRGDRMLLTMVASDEGGSGIENRSSGLVNDGILPRLAIRLHGSPEKGWSMKDTYMLGGGGNYETSGNTLRFYWSRYIFPQVLKKPGVYDGLLARICDRAGNCSGFDATTPEALKALPHELDFSVTITE